jgi:DNA-directed RNA polymerase specialized sigma24 family protein
MTLLSGWPKPGLLNTRKTHENEIYALWKMAFDEKNARAQEICEENLRTLLNGHAQAVMYNILRKADPALVVEAVDRVLISLPSFKGDCLFTTWAHRILMQVMYYQRRLNRRRREISMDIPGFDIPGESTAEMTDLLITVRQLLSDRDYAVFEHLVLLGQSREEAGKDLNIPKATLSRMWERISRTLKNAFVK